MVKAIQVYFQNSAFAEHSQFHDVTSSSLDSHVIATGSFDTCGPPPAWHAVLCLRKESARPIVAKWDGKNFGAVGRYWG